MRQVRRNSMDDSQGCAGTAIRYHAESQRRRKHPLNQNENQTLPPFQIGVLAEGLLREAEMDQLIADHADMLTQGQLGTGGNDTSIRRSRIAFLEKEKYSWLYRRLWETAAQLNRRFFCVDISRVESNVQIARYDSSDSGHYDWHTDFGDIAPGRKISISVQLSRPEDYEGGDLELMYKGEPDKAERARGALIAFPSFVLHRVSPVTRGTRWSLVAWIVGARWR